MMSLARNHYVTTQSVDTMSSHIASSLDAILARQEATRDQTIATINSEFTACAEECASDPVKMSVVITPKDGCILDSYTYSVYSNSVARLLGRGEGCVNEGLSKNTFSVKRGWWSDTHIPVETFELCPLSVGFKRTETSEFVDGIESKIIKYEIGEELKSFVSHLKKLGYEVDIIKETIPRTFWSSATPIVGDDVYTSATRSKVAKILSERAVGFSSSAITCDSVKFVLECIRVSWKNIFERRLQKIRTERGMKKLRESVRVPNPGARVPSAVVVPPPSFASSPPLPPPPKLIPMVNNKDV